MVRRINKLGPDGTKVGPRHYYSRIAGRDATKPRLRKKALKYVELTEEGWREYLKLKDMMVYNKHTFEMWYRQVRVIEKIRNNFERRQSFNRGLYEAYEVCHTYFTAVAKHYD